VVHLIPQKYSNSFACPFYQTFYIQAQLFNLRLQEIRLLVGCSYSSTSSFHWRTPCLSHGTLGTTGIKWIRWTNDHFINFNLVSLHHWPPVWLVWNQLFENFICKTDQSKPVKQEVNGTVILLPLSTPWLCAYFLNCFIQDLWCNLVKSFLSKSRSLKKEWRSTHWTIMEQIN
jgi:hypothetical protein